MRAVRCWHRSTGDPGRSDFLAGSAPADKEKSRRAVSRSAAPSYRCGYAGLNYRAGRLPTILLELVPVVVRPGAHADQADEEEQPDQHDHWHTPTTWHAPEERSWPPIVPAPHPSVPAPVHPTVWPEHLFFLLRNLGLWSHSRKSRFHSSEYQGSAPSIACLFTVA